MSEVWKSGEQLRLFATVVSDPAVKDPVANEGPVNAVEVQKPQLEPRRIEAPDPLLGAGAALLATPEIETANLGFLARLLVQTTLPHSEPEGFHFVRRNGDCTLTIMSSPDVGLPYGRYPRLLIAYVCTEAVRTANPHIMLGENLSQFLAGLGLKRTGGKEGTIGRVKDQIGRLFSSSINVKIDHRNQQIQGYARKNMLLADQFGLWSGAEDGVFKGAAVKLSEPFLEALLDGPVPVDMRALKALRSSLALDMYSWLGWRAYTLSRKGESVLEIPWSSLQLQFGSDYKQASKFRAAARRALKSAGEHLPHLDLEGDGHALRLELRPHPARVALSARSDS